MFEWSSFASANGASCIFQLCSSLNLLNISVSCISLWYRRIIRFLWATWGLKHMFCWSQKPHCRFPSQARMTCIYFFTLFWHFIYTLGRYMHHAMGIAHYFHCTERNCHTKHLSDMHSNGLHLALQVLRSPVHLCIYNTAKLTRADYTNDPYLVRRELGLSKKETPINPISNLVSIQLKS